MKQVQANQSVGKTLQIVEALAHSSVPMRLSDLSREVDMPPSTVLRMLGALEDAGYAYQEQDEPRRYGLTLRFLHIGQMAAEHFSLRDVGHPFLARASELTGEAGCIAIQEGNVIRYIDVTEGKGNLLTIRQRVGGAGKMHCTGSGKLFLSQFTEEQLDAFLAEKGLPALTSHTITTREDLLYELEACRKRGYAIDDEECETGMRCVAAPIRDAREKIVAVLSISGPITRMTRLRYETEIVPVVCEAARGISQKIIGKKTTDA